MSQLPEPAGVADAAIPAPDETPTPAAAPPVAPAPTTPIVAGAAPSPGAAVTAQGPDAVSLPADAASLPPAAGRPSPSSARLVVGVVLGAALAALGALLLGEYPFTGVMPYVSGVLFALVVAEVIVSVSRRSGRATAVAAAMCTAGGLAWGVWISVGEGKAPIPIGGWVAVVVGFVVALIRGGIRAGARPGASSQPAA
jgi:hypothetical protein